MKCPNCGYENKEGATYCEQCDELLEAEEGKWVYKDKEGIISRPCDSQEIQDLYDKGQITKKTLVRPEGSTEWEPFEKTELFAPFKSSSKKKIALIAIIIILVLAAAGAYGYNWYQDQQAQQKAAQEQENQIKVSLETAKESLTEYGWNIVEDKTYDFEEVPIPVYNKGYIVKVDGKYGIIGLDGKYLVEPTYEAITIDGAVAKNTVFYETSGDLSTAKSLEYLLKMDDNNTVNVPKTYEGITITSSRNVTLPDGLTKDDISTPITIIQESSWADIFSSEQKYYIWNPANDRVFGPFPISQPVMFILDEQMSEDYYPVPGLFFVERDGEYTIYANNGATKTTQTFDYADPISDSFMLVRNGDSVGTMDTSLKVTFIGEVENASAPVDGYDYVQIDGKWYRIYNPSMQGKEDENNAREEEETEKDTENEDSEKDKDEEDKDETDGSQYTLLYNMYLRTSPGGSVVSVQSAGTTIEIVSTQNVNGMIYGETSDGYWVCLYDGAKYYANEVAGSSDSDSDSE